ncbi:MAG: cell division protein FtsA [Candidatus Margulisiibacteriota bacterium]
MASKDGYYLGIDIGSSKIAAVICDIDANAQINLKGLGSSLTSGLVRGKIDDMDSLKSAIERAIKRAERTAEIRPKRAMIAIPSYRLEFVHSFGSLKLKEETSQVCEEDKAECIKRAKNMVPTHQKTILHVVPLTYKIDGQVAADPIGQQGRILEVETLIVLVDHDFIQQLTHVLHGLGLHISGLVYDLLASGQILVTEEEKNYHSLILDIGGKFTKVGVFRHGLLEHSCVLPLGGDSFTADLAYCLKTSWQEAERIKLNHGTTALAALDPTETVTVMNKEGVEEQVKLRLIGQILQARALEIIQLIKKELNPKSYDIQRSILTGRGTLLHGMSHLVHTHFKAPVRLGYPENIKPIVDQIEYASAVGGILFGLRSKAILPQGKSKYKVSTLLNKWMRDFF